MIEVMARISSIRGAPRTIRVDNGPEFISEALDRWADDNGATLDFSLPGKPTDNAFAKPFNGRHNDECLNTCPFLSLQDALAKIEGWHRDCNESRPPHIAWMTDASSRSWPRPGSRLSGCRFITLNLYEKPGDPQTPIGLWPRLDEKPESSQPLRATHKRE